MAWEPLSHLTANCTLICSIRSFGKLKPQRCLLTSRRFIACYDLVLLVHISSSPSMNNFTSTVLLYFFIWIAIFGLCVSISAGLIFQPKPHTDSNTYLFCGVFLGVASAIFVYTLNTLFDQQVSLIQYNFAQQLLELERNSSLSIFNQEVWSQDRNTKLQNLAQFKESLILLSSIFGAGVSGNLIVSSIMRNRESLVQLSRHPPELGST